MTTARNRRAPLLCLVSGLLLSTPALEAQPAQGARTSPAKPAQDGVDTTSPRGSLPPGHPPTGAGKTTAAALPPGHPPTGTNNPTAGALPPGHPPTGSDARDEPGTSAAESDLPPGHPPTGDAQNAAAEASPQLNPHAGAGAARDEAKPDASIETGKIVASIVDPTGQPLSGVRVRLGKMFQSIAEGDQTDSEYKTTDNNGQVSFSDLQTESNFSYRISVQNGRGEFASMPFQLSRDKGQRVLLHVYPVTSDIKEARIALRGLVYVQPRDDVFQFEVWLQVFNVSQIAWVPEDVVVGLPSGSKAFSAREMMQDTRAEALAEDRARIMGTFAPGQHDVRFGFQVPNQQSGSASFQLSLPPNVAEFRVITEAGKGMSLSVSDFPPVQTSTGMRGERVLVSQKRGGDLGSVSFQIAGLPTRGSAPWVAVLIAGFAAVSGLYSARNSQQPNQKKRRLKGDLKQARSIILDELTALEAAHKRGDVGPKSYQQTRRALLNALARILQPT